MILPPRDSEAEQRFLHQFQQAPQAEIQQAITFAIDARRPQLAAQLFLLLEDLTPLNPELNKAQKALGFAVVGPQHWSILEQTWERFNSSKRIQRMKTRYRDKNDLRNRPWKKR